MKRLLCLLFVCFILAGCSGGSGETESLSLPTETQAPPSFADSWIEQTGKPWDTAGMLLEVPLTVPDGLHFDSARELDGDLLLWSVDSHLEDQCTVEMCLVELDDGTVAAENEIVFSQYVFPQVLEDRIYFCDSGSGRILELDKNLQVSKEWTSEPWEGNWYMDTKGTLYGYDWEGNAYAVNLDTGEQTPLLEGDPYVSYMYLNDDTLIVEYYHPDTGIVNFAAADLSTGEMFHLPENRIYTSATYQDGVWLCDAYKDGSVCYLGTGGEDMVYADMGYDSLQQTDDNLLLRTMEDGCRISLHDAFGRFLSQCTITEQPYSYSCSGLIPSEQYGGYFLLLYNEGGYQRLLYWDTSKPCEGEDIPFAPVPEPSGKELEIREHIVNIQEKYGINVLVGNDCQTSYFNFEAELVTDWDMISDALDTLENALADYPEGFFRQLRYGTIRRIDIHLVGTLYPYDTQEYVDSYCAFVQEEYDHFLMAADIQSSWEETYYHEFSHMIDLYLAWDSRNREGALYSEEGWEALNPSWFTGYSYDYSVQHSLEDYESFIDGYSTIKPTEDRARVMEYAMADYGFYSFDCSDVLQKKLDYYCRCIRDAFDTTGWPEELLWEQYL